MKSIRVLFALTVFAVGAGLASADCGTCEKKETCDKADKACAEQCDKAKVDCPKDCDKPCCKKDAACDATKGCDKDKAMACCAEAAKAGKTCEKCNPPVKK